MNTFLSILKKFPWWFWVGIVVLILVVWQLASGGSASRKLYQMALDNLREDQTNIINQKEEWIKTCEAEIARLEEERERIQKEKANIQRRASESAAEVARLKGRIGELQTQLQSIIISDDPDRIIDDLHKFGLKSIKRRSH
jgi:chromosome segregation ATPase